MSSLRGTPSRAARLGLRRAIITVVLLACLAGPIAAAPVFLGGSGGISFGVSPYGAPVPGIPTYIPNNVTGLNDILASPGGTFLTANPVIANNTFSTPVIPLPVFGVWAGGGNANGPFGSGAVSNFGTQVNFGLQDPVAGGGSASYAISSWTSTFVEPVGYAGAFGTYLAIGGILPAVDAAAVASLRTRITSVNPASPFFGGVDLPQLVLANAQVAPQTYSFVALGGAGAAMIVTDQVLGTFQGLAINNAAVAIPAGDVFLAVSTLTVFADPSALFAIDPDTALIAATGATLPDVTLLSSSTIPEPSTFTAMVIGLVLLIVIGGRRISMHTGRGAAV